MVAAVTVVKLVAFVLIMAFLVAVGLWLGLWAAYRPSHILDDEPLIGHLRAGLRSRRQARRKLLTLKELTVAWAKVLLSVVLIPAGVIVLLAGGSGLHGLGIVLLVLGLVVMAIPISPILQTRVRRRQRASGSR